MLKEKDMLPTLEIFQYLKNVIAIPQSDNDMNIMPRGEDKCPPLQY